MNNVIISGYAVSAPQFFQAGNREVALLTVASQRPYKNKQGGHDADFIQVKIWTPSNGKHGALDFIEKGKLVSLKGEIRTSSREVNGQMQYFQDIEVPFNSIQLLGAKK